jgi:hypothetical protein
MGAGRTDGVLLKVHDLPSVLRIWICLPRQQRGETAEEAHAAEAQDTWAQGAGDTALQPIGATRMQ